MLPPCRSRRRQWTCRLTSHVRGANAPPRRRCRSRASCNRRRPLRARWRIGASPEWRHATSRRRARTRPRRMRRPSNSGAAMSLRWSRLRPSPTPVRSLASCARASTRLRSVVTVHHQPSTSRITRSRWPRGREGGPSRRSWQLPRRSTSCTPPPPISSRRHLLPSSRSRMCLCVPCRDRT